MTLPIGERVANVDCCTTNSKAAKREATELSKLNGRKQHNKQLAGCEVERGVLAVACVVVMMMNKKFTATALLFNLELQ